MDFAWKSIFETGLPPIYYQERVNKTLFYSPGHLAVVPTPFVNEFRSTVSELKQSSRLPAANHLIRNAQEAQQAWLAMKVRSFTPTCLTLYMHNECNMACTYCFSKPYRNECAKLSLEVICSAAEIVASNCVQQNLPLTIVFHGGGEPTLDFDLLLQTLALVEEIGQKNGLRLFRYIATNGIMARSRANILAERFDLIGLSCDGPDEIQNRQRPLSHARNFNSAHLIEQTAEAVHAANKPLHIRVTITPESLTRQTEIADYLCNMLKPQEIHVEVVYAGNEPNDKCAFSLEKASAYINAFLDARKTALAYGVPWRASGSRPGEIHYAFCHIWRNVLNLAPGDSATACFKISDTAAAKRSGMTIGSWNQQDNLFRLDKTRIKYLKQVLGNEPEVCITCFNRFHCARQCPDVCLAEPDSQKEGFRCRIQALLANALIQETAEKLTANRKLDQILFGNVPGLL